MKCYITKEANRKKGEKKEPEYYKSYGEWEREVLKKGDELFNGNEEKLDREKLNEIFKGIYHDPDAESNSMYEDLACFLNQREDKAFGLKEKYKYEFSVNPLGIKVMDESGEELFYLKADQLGFSNDHQIYVDYLKGSLKKEDALKNYAGWLYESRSIGGCFLWPMEEKTDEKRNVKWENSPYNQHRGRGYAEDRADMALADVKRYYDGDKNWLYDSDVDENEKKLRGNLKKWLDHFGKKKEGFKRYIEFFCFEPFMDMKQLNPKNMRGQNEETIENFEIEKEQGKISEESVEEIEEALIKLNSWINDRSKEIERIIKKSKKQNL